MRRRRVTAAGALLAGTIFAAGACSSGSDKRDAEERSTISLAEWTRAVDKICAASSNARAGAVADVDPFDADLTKSQLNGATDLIDNFADELNASVTDFNALDTPDDQQETAQEFIDATQTAADNLSAATNAGNDRDLGEFKSQVKSGAKALDDATAAAKKLKLQQCGGDSGVGSSTTAPPTTGAAKVPGV